MGQVEKFDPNLAQKIGEVLINSTTLTVHTKYPTLTAHIHKTEGYHLISRKINVH